MKRGRVIELWLAGFVLVVSLIVGVVLLGTAAADGPPMPERAHLSFSHIHNLLPTNTVHAFGHLSAVGNIIKKKKVEVDPLCNEQDGCYPYSDGCEERDYYCAGNGTSCNYTSSNRHTDMWVDTGNTRWVDEKECQGKEQKEQEYRDYECSTGSCNYSITDTKWIDTGIYNSTCIGVSAAPLEITSFAPFSYVNDTVGNWRAFNVTVNQTANVSWYLNDTLVLTNESVLEPKCMLLADVVGEHNVTAIASNANGSDMQMWIWAVTSETQTIGTGTKTITQTINVSNSFPMFSNAEYVHFTIGNDNITLTLDDNASFDGVCNLSDLMGRYVSVAGTTVELTYFPITYQGVSHDQKWVSAPFFDDVEHKLYLLAGSGLIKPWDLEIRENSTATPIPKVVGVGDTGGNFTIQTAAEGTNSADNYLSSQIVGVGFADLYVQYAPDTSYENITFIPSFSQCEQLMLRTDSIGSFICYEADMIGVAEGTEPVPAVSPDWNVSLELDVEYYPTTYQNHTYDQEWMFAPSFDDTTHRLHLLAGSGLIAQLDLEIMESATGTPIPKVAGVGDLVGNFKIKTAAEGINSADNSLSSQIAGVGAADLYVQYAPDTSYENITFIPSFSQCEQLMLRTDSIGSFICYAADMIGVAEGTEPVSDVSPDWNVSLEFDVEYYPTTYQNHTYDQKWMFAPSFDDTTHRLHLLAGSGLIAQLDLEIRENSTTTPIPKVVGVGSTVGQFQIETFAEGSNSNYNWLESNIKGVGYANIYVQYAPDTSYENTPFLPTFSECERLQVSIDSSISGSESKVAYQVDVLGVANGAEPILLVSHDWNLSLDLDVEYFPMTYQNISHDQKWEVFPFFDDAEHKLYLLSGSGIITASKLEMKENATDKAIPKVVGVGSTVGQFQIETVAEGSSSNYNSLESDIKGIGYANIYAQYAPDTSYEDITFIPTFSQCERLQLNTHSNGSVVTCAAKMLGVWTGSECLMFNGIPLDMVTIDETFDLTYHPVIISEDEFDEKWSVEPEQYEDTLVILRGTGAMTALNFIYNDSTAAHPEISSYGYLRGDYTITANIIPHYMAVVANGPDVAAMGESEQGGFGVNFSGEPSPCFIATAAYGTPLHEDINVLRKFRDEYMMPNPAGQAMVKIYYTISPPVANLIRANEGLRTTVRDSLVKPLVEVTRLFVE